LEKVGKLV